MQLNSWGRQWSSPSPRFEKSKESMSQSIETLDTLIFGPRVLDLSKTNIINVILRLVSRISNICFTVTRTAAYTTSVAHLSGYLAIPYRQWVNTRGSAFKGGKDSRGVQPRCSTAPPKLLVASKVMVTRIPRNPILPFFEPGIESDIGIGVEYSRLLFQWKVYEKMNLIREKAKGEAWL